MRRRRPVTSSLTTTAEEPIRLRPPLWSRVYAAVFGVAWCALLVSIAVRTGHRNLPAAAGMLVAGAAITGCQLRLAVTATTNRLVIRNRITTTVLDRHDVEGFRAGPANQGLPLSWCAYALTADRRVVPLMATARPGFRRPPRQVRHATDLLQQWLAETPIR